MGCNSPLDGWYARSKNPSGKRSVVFNPQHGYLDMPVKVPCGRCLGCRLDYSAQWSGRMLAEAKFHEDSRMVTYTYDDDHLPEDRGINVRDLQLMHKRMRADGLKFRFAACGEYGDHPMVPGSPFVLGRPHYHVIYFGLGFPDAVRTSRSRSGLPQWQSEYLTRTWGKGRVVIGEFNEQAAKYVARYVTKKLNGDMADSRYQQLNEHSGEVFAVRREFFVTSRRPGLGVGFYDRWRSDIYPHDEMRVLRGSTFKVPRAFDRKLEVDDPALYAKVKGKRRRVAKLKALDNTPERLAVKEEILYLKSKARVRA